MYVRDPLSFRNAEHLLHDGSIDISQETDRLWWYVLVRCLPDISARKASAGCAHIQIDSCIWTAFFVKIKGETHYLWRTVDREGEVLEGYVSMR